MKPPRAVGLQALLTVLLLGGIPGLAAALLSERSLQDLDLPAAGLALALWLGLVLARPRLPHLMRPPLVLLAALAVLPTAVAWLAFDATVSNDESAYLLQAELLAEGRVSEALPQPACKALPGPVLRYTGLCPLHRRQVYEDHARGVRFAKYPPGAAVALAPGAAVGLPHLMVALAGLLDVFLLLALCRRMRLLHERLAALLLLLCPFFLLVQTSFQSEVFTLPAALAGYLGLLAQREQSDPTGRRGRLSYAGALLVGAAAGWMFLVRPLTGLVFALACAPGLLRLRAARAPDWRGLLAAVLGGLPFLLLFLLYNHVQTGNALQTPYDLYARQFGPFENGAPVDVYGNGDLLAGLLDQAGRWSIGLCGILGAAALGFWGLWRLRVRDGGAGLLFATLLPAAYALHWFPGHWAYPGPLYAFESLGLLLLGVVSLLEAAPAGWRPALPVAALLGALLLAPYRFSLAMEQVAQRAAPARAARSAPADAVVLLPFDGGRHLKVLQPSRAVRSGTRVLVQELPDAAATAAALEQLGLGDRPRWRFHPGSVPGSGQIEPAGP